MVNLCSWLRASSSCCFSYFSYLLTSSLSLSRKSFRERLCMFFCSSSTKLSLRFKACCLFEGRSVLNSFVNYRRKLLSSSSNTLRHSVFWCEFTEKCGCCNCCCCWCCCMICCCWWIPTFGMDALSFIITSLSFSTGRRCLLTGGTIRPLSEFFLLLIAPLKLSSLSRVNEDSDGSSFTAGP